MPKRKYRIGLIVDRPDVAKWVRDLASWANDHPAIELAAVVVAGPARETFLDKLFRLESRLLCRGSAYRPYTVLHPIEGCAPMQVEAADLAEVAELNLDALVRCGRGTSPEGLAELSRDGIVSISSDGFREIVAGRAETAFTIERVRRDGENPETLFTGSVATALLYAWNMISRQSRAFQYLGLTLERLASGRAEAIAAAPRVGGRAPAGALLGYAVRTGQRSFAKMLRRLLGQEFNWQVAVSEHPWSDGRFEQARVVPNPRNAFLADPFTITVNGATHLFVEEFPYDSRKGVISAYRLDGAKAERIGVVLEEPYHLSFPFVFEHGGEIYMVPEGGGGRSVKLYKASSFPTGWTEVKTLLSDVPAVDTLLFEHGSRWWMLTTIQGEGPGLNNAELHAFHADSPLDEWTPHERNPIVIDAGKGRNGGFVRVATARPCRVAQVPGFTFYGAGSAVYRIDELTPESYRETLVEQVEPTFFPGLDGTHHIHCAGRNDRVRLHAGGTAARSRPRTHFAPVDVDEGRNA